MRIDQSLGRDASPERGAWEIVVRGVVQGVGFRPFVHRLALRYGLAGWVRNEWGSVRIAVEGDGEALSRFLNDLEHRPPPLARVASVSIRPREATGLSGFLIVRSDVERSGRLPVPPDTASCAACISELLDPQDRRYRYPFITCTDCGPRFTVIRSMPYDRERTSMAEFSQCPRCLEEYNDPENRRHHSETNCCPDCGPMVWLVEAPEASRSEPESNRTPRGEEAIRRAAALLRDGKILALRGLGGFHLAVDATRDEAVFRLRRRKMREAKPLAVMVPSLDEARRLARISAEEADLLMSAERPIVLVEQNLSNPILAPSVAPGLTRVGVMLPYTPLHHLLLAEVDRPLVMTSGNRSEEPIATDNADALAGLSGIADAFLLHNREIVARYDDSVVRVVDGAPMVLRRSRGYAPLPIRLPISSPRPLLAVGPHLKNTFTLAEGDEAFTSQHIGDLENLETLEHFKESLARLQSLLRLEPEIVVRDLHPGYLSTRVALESGADDVLTVQHHHAHVAAVLAEHGETGPVVGIVFDGTGLGEDGKIWGAEFLIAGLESYRRAAHLRYAALPGGDLASREPWRALLGYSLLEPGAESVFEHAFHSVPREEMEAARWQTLAGVNVPKASSMGRLFDAAACLIGLRTRTSYEGQAAMELEATAGRREGFALPFPVLTDADGTMVLDPLPLLHALEEGRRRGVSPDRLAGAFHDAVVRATVRVGAQLAGREGITQVALSGGCFQNVRLLTGVASELRRHGLKVLIPRRTSPNDGGISLGQAAIGAARLSGGDR